MMLPTSLFFLFKKIEKYIRLRLVRRNILIMVITCALLANLVLLFTAYRVNKQRQEELRIENVSDVIYLLELFSSAYSSLPGKYQQFLIIVKALTDYSELPITIATTPSYPTLEGFNSKLCSTVQMPVEAQSSMMETIISKLRERNISEKLGISFYNHCTGYWVNIKFPSAPEFIFLTSSIGIQTIITIIFLWYILSIYNLYKPWSRIKNSFGSLGIKTKSMVLPSFGPNIVRYIAQLMDALVDRVEVLLKERTVTIAALSHDIRTSLAKLRLYVELSEDTYLQNKVLPKVDQIDTYLSMVLDYAKESYQLEKKCQLDMMALLDAVGNDYIDSGLPLTMNLEPAKVILFGQPNNLERAFANLIDNAIKYGDKVDIKASYQAGYGLVIKVSDEGPGLPEDELENVFQPFYRGINSQIDKVPGSGLGLAIVKNILSYNNGVIYLANKPDGGLQAVVTFAC